MTAAPRELARDIAGATAAHAALVAALATLTDAEVARPSLLPGWTVGHVLAHIARNADSHVRLLQAADRGEVGQQYPGGSQQRIDDIDAGAGRPAHEHVADIAATAQQLEAAWAATTEQGWRGEGSSAAGVVKIDDLPFRRWRETVVHHADLGLGYTWADWPHEYVRLELQRATMLWASRKPMGLTTLPVAAAALPDSERLAWLLGRTVVPGLEPAGIF
ncbi:MAG: maleylpyruvate isomerase family mycothiol-dependent enzyme [Actinomycetota bacterium]|nr:maleylpyruvate isomerase family mycothiol-dependent enzyme [Actinomycetota bacterium]